MASLTEIRARVRIVLAEAADTAGLTVATLTPASTPVLPAVVLQPAEGIEFAARPAGRGMTTYPWNLLVLVSGAELEVAEPALDELVAADGPIRASFAADPHLGLGGGTTAWIDSMDYGIGNPWAQQDLDVLGASLRLIVRTTG